MFDFPRIRPELSQGKQPHVSNKTLDGLKVLLYRRRKGAAERLGHDELNTGIHHLLELTNRDSFLKRQEMFLPDPVSFIKDLSPSILQVVLTANMRS